MIIAVIERQESRSGVHSKCPVDTKRPSLTHVGRRLAVEEWPSISGVECGVHLRSDDPAYSLTGEGVHSGPTGTFSHRRRRLISQTRAISNQISKAKAAFRGG